MKFNISKLQGTVEGIPFKLGIDLSNIEERLDALESKLGTSQSTSEPAKFFTDEYGFLFDACECGAYITRQTNEGQAVVVDYVKFTGKYTKTFVGTDTKDVFYLGNYSSSDEQVLVNQQRTTVIYDGEGFPVIMAHGSFIKPVTVRSETRIDPEGGIKHVTTYPELDALKDYTYEALDCCVNK